MARVGLSYPRYAKYNYSDGNVTYFGGGSLGKAISINVSIDGASDNTLYADNGPAESVNMFTGGTVTLGTDDLYDDAAVDILGLETNEITSPEAAKEILEGESQQAPYVGVGYIIKHIRAGKTAYTGVVLTKVQFSNPGDDIKTQGDEIEWQTPEIEGTILRDDSEKRLWRRRATWDEEENAKKYVDGILNIAEDAQETA